MCLLFQDVRGMKHACSHLVVYTRTYQVLICREDHVLYWHIEIFCDLAFQRLNSGALRHLNAFQSIPEGRESESGQVNCPAGASRLTFACT